MKKVISIIVGGVIISVLVFSVARIISDGGPQEVSVKRESSAQDPRNAETQEADMDSESAPQEDGRETGDEVSENFPVEDMTQEEPKETTEEKEEKPAEKEDAQAPEDFSANISVRKNFVTWGFEKAENRDIYAVILHSSYNPNGGDKYDTEKIIDIYKGYGVSPHYIISRDGTITQLVDEKNIAYHAGVSRLPNGETDVNRVSIGIEIVTSDDSDDEPTSKQYDAINRLLKDIKSRHDIKYVLGHDDIAPGRKTDPWNFSWDKIVVNSK